MKPKRAPSFESVVDSRKRKIKGLCQRAGRYYAQIRMVVDGGKTAPRRVPLNARTLTEATAALEKIRTENRAGALPVRGIRPAFDAFAREYIDGPTLAQKKKGTRENEKQALNRWVQHLGALPVDKITTTHIHDFHEKRQKGAFGLGPASGRTINLDTVALRNVLKLALERGHVAKLPVVKKLKHHPRDRKRLITPEEFRALLDACGVTKNGAQFRLYLRFLALTGAREQEALQVRWSDIDMARELVTIGTGGVAKNRHSRTVDFSPDLRALMDEMQAIRPPDSQWLFPSPQRGKKDIPARKLRQALAMVRDAAGLPWFAFHDLRHMFASRCVMAGIDYMTISQWLGHRDGGILVGKVYGHIADTHKRQAAQKLKL